MNAMKKHAREKGYKLNKKYYKNERFFNADNGFVEDMIPDIIEALTIKHYDKGPMADKEPDKYEGWVWVYIYDMLHDFDIPEVIYIKIRYNPPDEMVIISFHDDEYLD